jgi:hypothetical protein
MAAICPNPQGGFSLSKRNGPSAGGCWGRRLQVPGVTSSALFLMWVRNLPMPIKFGVRERPVLLTRPAPGGRDDGAILTDDAVECSSPEAAVEMRPADVAPAYVGAVAFTRSGYALWITAGIVSMLSTGFSAHSHHRSKTSFSASVPITSPPANP